MKRGFPLLILLTVSCLCDARPARYWSYKDLTAEADVVVIATPTDNQDAKEPAAFPNMQRTGADGKSAPVPAVGVETKFEVQAVLKGEKGEKELKTFIFYHLRHPTPENLPNGPMLVTFEPKERKRYLMFLKRDGDGRYVPLTGQLDSAVAVKELGTYP
jgi:hypothetical protein